jgi:uncharacterized protein
VRAAGLGRRRVGALALAGALLAGCGGGSDDAQPAPPGVGQRIEETVEAELGGVRLTLEVADEPEERRVGLMGRTEVPPGTGMVFRWDEPLSTSFWMFQVPVPLVAVFVRDGVAIHVERMAPCDVEDSAQCPSYGPPPGEVFDTVVETAPETLPGVAIGDRLEYR